MIDPNDPAAKALRKHLDAKKRAQKEKALARKYGLSIAGVERMLREQGGRCAICLRNEEEYGYPLRFCVDHDHRTGLVRGILCGACNDMLLDSRQDDPDLWRQLVKEVGRERADRALSYLRRAVAARWRTIVE